jgi:hypothetical protein
MSLKIAGKSFRVETALLGGAIFDKSWRKYDPSIGEGLAYFLEIACEPKTVRIDGQEEEWEPQLTFGRFSIATDSWPEIESTALNNVDGTGFLDYHDTAIATSISFGKRAGCRFKTNIRGKCCNVDFEFDGPVIFDGYRVVGTFRDSEESLTDMLSSQIDLWGLVAEDSTVDASIPKKKMRAKIFTPASRLPKRAG